MEITGNTGVTWSALPLLYFTDRLVSFKAYVTTRAFEENLSWLLMFIIHIYSALMPVLQTDLASMTWSGKHNPAKMFTSWQNTAAFKRTKVFWFLFLAYRVIIWKCIVNKCLVQICIEEHRQTIYIVRTHKMGHFICSTNWVVICNDCLAAGGQSDTLISGLVSLQSTQGFWQFSTVFPCLCCEYGTQSYTAVFSWVVHRVMYVTSRQLSNKFLRSKTFRKSWPP